MKKIILLLLVSIFLSGAALYKRTYILMGTFVQITLTQQKEKLVDETAKKMQVWEDELSVFKKESEIKKINSLGKDELKRVSRNAYEVIKESIYYSELTDGTFDITVSPLLKLWEFEGGELKAIPRQEEIDEALQSVGWENIILTPGGKVGFKKDGMSINLGGIAKGYIVDKAAEYLKRKRVKSAIINAGGDIYCFGKKDNGQPWSIGIQHPRNKKEVIGTLTLTDKAVVTSGDYEKFLILQGKRFSHIIDPRNGYPADNHIVQVTIVADTCIEADALATALMVMGKEKGLKLIEKLPNTEAVITEEIEGKLDIFYTPGLKESIKIDEN